MQVKNNKKLYYSIPVIGKDNRGQSVPTYNEKIEFYGNIHPIKNTLLYIQQGLKVDQYKNLLTSNKDIKLNYGIWDGSPIEQDPDYIVINAMEYSNHLLLELKKWE